VPETALLLDNNISHRVIPRIGEIFPHATHVMHEGLDRADDKEVWSFAKNHGYAIVTKDADFNELTILYGAPPKIVWIKTGNCRVDEIVTLLRREHETIEEFLSGDDAILEIR
jgi:predicted nuclease of predicted toxin-antitoxin system